MTWKFSISSEPKARIADKNKDKQRQHNQQEEVFKSLVTITEAAKFGIK